MKVRTILRRAAVPLVMAGIVVGGGAVPANALASTSSSAVNTTLGDLVWSDLNANGKQDASEPGIKGLTVTVYSGTSSKVVTTTKTDSKGLFRAYLPTGGSYSYTVTRPEGCSFTTKTGVGASTDSNMNPSTGRTDVVAVPEGTLETKWDTGVVCSTIPSTGPVTATIVGAASIPESDITPSSYTVQTSRPLDKAVTYCVKAVDGTAKYANGGGPQSLYFIGTAATDKDYTVKGVAYGACVNVIVPAGSTTSAPFAVNAWLEKVMILAANLPGDGCTIENGYLGFKDKQLEGNETFSLRIESSTAGTGVTLGAPKQVSIVDNPTFHEFITVQANFSVLDQLGVGYYCRYGSPISIDLNGDGIKTVALEDSSARFDLLGDGRPVTSGWLSPEDAFLAHDADGDGSITSVRELFGGQLGEGYAKLATYDTTGDGVIDARDTTFDTLSIWQDVDGDKATDPGELRSLAAAGITRLEVTHTDAFEQDAHGNFVYEHSSATMRGERVDMADVYFRYE